MKSSIPRPAMINTFEELATWTFIIADECWEKNLPELKQKLKDFKAEGGRTPCEILREHLAKEDPDVRKINNKT